MQTYDLVGKILDWSPTGNDVTYFWFVLQEKCIKVLLFRALFFLKLFNFLQSRLAKLSKDRPIMATIPPLPYHIVSVNTKAFAVSTPNDKPGEEVKTKSNRDEQTVCAQVSTLAFF